MISANAGITNAVVMLSQTGPRERRVLLLTHKHGGGAGLPGGNIDPLPGPKPQLETPWRAMKREYREETGTELPHINLLATIVWQGHTVIFVAEAQPGSVAVGPPTDPKARQEITDRRLTRVSDLRQAVNGRTSWHLRPEAKTSTGAVLQQMGWCMGGKC